MRIPAFIAIVACLQLVLPPRILAQAVPVNLDLSSTNRTVTASGGGSGTAISVGGTQVPINAGDLITAAEHTALQQVIMTGQQSIQLSALGHAIGGTVNLSNHMAEAISSLVVPNGVTAVHDFSTNQLMNILGNFNNSGNFYAYSSNPQVNTGTINALNIFNNHGATLSSVLPSELGLTSAVSEFNLVLNAVQDIVNAGTISSSGSLTATAGGSITNALPTGTSGPSAVMTAVNNLNLQANNIVNSGLMQSSAANINIMSQAAANMAFNNSAGRLEAMLGAINVRDASFVDKANFALSGGDVLSRELNIHSGTGKVTVNVGELSGTVNISAGEAVVAAATENLALGNVELSGDPAFFNTSGNVTVSSSMIFPGQPLSIIANKDIVTNVSGLIIDTSSPTGNAGNILLVAGADFTSDGTTLTISGGSATGGKIDLGTFPIFTFSARGATSGTVGNGGQVSLIAYGGTGAAAGTIKLPTLTAVSVQTFGKGTGSGGDITVIAGAASGSGTAIAIRDLDTRGGAGGVGNITVATALPVINNAPMTINAVTGSILNGSFSVGAILNNSIQTNNLSTPGATITVISGANALLGSLSSVGNGTPGSTGGLINLTVNSATPFQLGSSVGCTNCVASAQATATTSGINGNAGVINVTNNGAGGIRFRTLSALSIPVLTLNGNGGTINVDAGSGFVDIPAGTLSANGVGTGKGGNIIIRGSSIINSTGGAAWTFNARGGATGSGGLVSLTSTDAGSSLSTGTLAGQITTINVQPGLSAGHGGSVVLSSGSNLTVNAAAILIKPQAANGNGGNLQLIAGSAGSGNLQVTGSLSADGNGTGNGGTVVLRYADANPFVVGSALTSSGVSGNVSAKAASSGAGGVVAIENSSGSLNVALTGSVSATSLTGPSGSILLNNGGDVNVSGTGSLNGTVSSSGSSVSLSVGGTLVGTVSADTTISLSTTNALLIGSGSGAVSIATPSALLNASAPTVTISMPASSVNLGNVSATNAVSMNVSGAVVNGTVQGSTVSVSNADDVSLTGTGTVNGALSVSSANGSATIDLPSIPAANVSAATSVTLNSGTSLSVGTGTGAVSLSPASILLNASAPSISVDLVGSDVNFGSVQATAGNLTVAAHTLNVQTLASASGDVNINAESVALSGTMQATNVTVSNTGDVTLNGTGTVSGFLSVSSSAGAVNVVLPSISSATLSALTAINLVSGSALSIGTAAGDVNLATPSAILTAMAPAIAINIGGSDLNVGSLIASAGNLTASAQTLNILNAATASGDMVLSAAQITNSGNISAGGNMTLNAPVVTNNGTLATSGASVIKVENSADVSFTGSGSISSNYFEVVSTGGSVSIDMNSTSATVSGSAATSFSVHTPSGLTMGSTVASEGNLNVITDGGLLAVAAGASLASNEGNLVVQNTDASNGSVIIGQGASLSAQSAGTEVGRVFVVVGDIPSSPDAGTAPSGFTVNAMQGGKVFFGQNGISTTAGGNVANVSGSRVIFSTGTAPGTAITLDGDVMFNATAVNPVPLTIGSLDLTDPQTVSVLLEMQAASVIGGTLIVEGGIAVGGDLILSPSNIEPQLSAENIPANVTLTLQGFGSANPLNIALTSNSTTSQVTISGTHQFVGSSSEGVLLITSTESGSTFVLANGGQLLSEGSMSVTTQGDMQLGGLANAAMNLSLSTTNDGNIALASNVTAGGALSISAHGTGSIQQTAGMLNGATLQLASASGNIGSSASSIKSSASGLAANTSGNVYVQQFGATALSASSAGALFMLKSNANITQQSGAIVASAVDLCTTNGGSIGSLLSPVQTQAVDLKLVASGNVFVSELNGVTLANSKAGGQFSLSSGGPLTTSSVETSNGSITLTANGGLRVSPLSLIYANEGNITLRDSNTSTGSIKIGTLSAIFAYTTGHPNKGNVSILIGPDPVAPVKEGPHQWVVGVKHNGGQIFWGANGIKGTLLPNFVFALGRNVVFNTGTRPASAIELQGGVTITADPPFTASAPISASLTPQQTSHSSNPINAKEFLPVAFVQPTVGTVSGSRSGDACIANQRLFSPSRDVTVQSGDCEVSIRAGSVVLITEGPVTKIANVFEQAANSVQVSYRHQQPVKVACGNEVAFASNAAEINQALGKDSIGRRNVRNYELSGGALTRCEVSMVSLMQNSHALRDLLHSNNPKDRATAAKLMKMAACVMMTTTNRGSYKQAR